MAWMACHLFVSCSDPSSLVELLIGLLEDRAHRTDMEGLADAPAPLVITPSLEGWSAIIGAASWIVDMPWAARQLSCSPAGERRAVSCEIFGNCLRLRVADYRSGDELGVVQTPDHGWGDDREPARMPLYEDVELLAFARLREAGIPAPLITIGTLPLTDAVGGEDPPADRLQDLQDLGEGITLEPNPEGGGVQRGQRQLQIAPFEGESPPVIPASIGHGFALNLFEDRYVEGLPNDAAVDRLLELEEALLQRATTVRPGKKVDLTVTYYGGVHQDRLDALLHARGRYTPPSSPRDRPPWWAFWRHLGRIR